MNNKSTHKVFAVKDCALATIATGIKAQNLVELRDRVATIPINSIYFHFWSSRLRTAFEYSEYYNDFSHWASHFLHDEVLAERLALLNPTEYQSLENLRFDLVEILDNRIDEKEYVLWTKLDECFHFISSKIVIFQTRHVLREPKDLVTILPLLTRSSLFYHFIDSALRVPDKVDDFSTWLQEFGEEYYDLIETIRNIDPYLISLTDLQNKLIDVVTKYFKR